MLGAEEGGSEIRRKKLLQSNLELRRLFPFLASCDSTRLDLGSKTSDDRQLSWPRSRPVVQTFSADSEIRFFLFALFILRIYSRIRLVLTLSCVAQQIAGILGEN